MPSSAANDGGRKAAIADIVTRYGRGDSIRKIAAATGRSYGGVHSILVEAKVEFRPRGGPHPTPLTTEQARAVVVRYVRDRQTIKQIVAETPWSYKVVRDALTAENVNLRSSRQDS